MPDVRFRIDHEQLGLIIKVMEHFLQDKPRGEALNMVWSILDHLVVRLRRRHAERRLEYSVILTVYQALALRRMALAGQELYGRSRATDVLRHFLSELDPKLTKYTI